MKPLPRWDNGRDVVLAGDAAGVVAPASGEGIYYAMAGGRLAAEAVDEFLRTGRAAALAGARKRFMKAHGKVFLVLGIMQRFWYSSDKRRERFVSICKDPDVQQLTFDAYMNKELVRKRPMAHVRIFFKDMAHLLGTGACLSRAPPPRVAPGRWQPIAAAAAGAVGVAVLGALTTDIGPWYLSLRGAGLEAARRAVRPGLDHDLRARRASPACSGLAAHGRPVGAASGS